jgi:2-(1,2-epoxy-1,2-dihydrophenyl)acetyl-CoA isomerase
MTTMSVYAEQDDGVLTIILDRPKVNAFDLPMVDTLLVALATADEDDSVRCVVLTGSGRVFSAGQDISEIQEAGDDIHYRGHLERTYNQVVRKLRAIEKPIIGAINGHAAGAGLGIAVATDIRWASESASFSFGFTRIGLAADSGTSIFLPMLLGLSMASEFAFDGRALTAEEAYRNGLVSRVFPDSELRQEVHKYALKLAAGPTRAIGLTKRAFNQAALQALDGALTNEAILQEIAGQTADHKEGVAAFLEKRPPIFSGA